jgi:hypothetical protein
LNSIVENKKVIRRKSLSATRKLFIYIGVVYISAANRSQAGRATIKAAAAVTMFYIL